MPAYEDLNAAELLRRWRQIVNGNNAAGRDGQLLKDYLLRVSPIQVLLGMYQYRGVRTISIPQFLRQDDEWLETDLTLAKIELARCVANKTPPSYYTWMDWKDEDGALASSYTSTALHQLITWADGVLA